MTPPKRATERRGRARGPSRSIRLKRAYDSAAPGDGKRILVDRLWPRGVRKAAAHLDGWRRELAPSEELRRWYGHDPTRFGQFRLRYRVELLRQRDALASLVLEAERGPVTLVYAARDSATSNAAVLRELLEELR